MHKAPPSTPRGPETYLDKGILEDETVGCQLVDVWGPYELVPITAQGGAQVIHDDEKDIQSICTQGWDFSEITCTDTAPLGMVSAS